MLGLGKLLRRVRDAFATLSRRLPPMRGWGRVWRFFNRLFLMLGAPPLAQARLDDGTILRVDLRTRTETTAYYQGHYERDLLDTVLRLYDCDTDFLDIGANIGFYAVPIAASIKRRSGSGRIWAFEPFLGNCKRLRANLALNDLTALVEVCEFGLSDRDRDAVLILREDFALGAETGNASLAISAEFDRGFATTRVALRALDSADGTAPRAGVPIGFVKIDVEGHKDACLQGAVRTFAAHRPTILMEVNKPYYRARGVDLDTRIRPLIPSDYAIFRHRASAWQRVDSLDACASIDNVFCVPGDKLRLDRYRRTFV